MCCETCTIMMLEADYKHRVLSLKKEKNAVILAHNYQLPEVQDVADVIGDSLALSRTAAQSDADTIVFCGVHFMAETAAIICPDKQVLIPDPDAGCSLAASINARELKSWIAEHHDAVVVSYVNTTAEVKALSDYCCTSSNAVNVVNSIPSNREILFLPDMFLGSYVAKMTKRKNMLKTLMRCSRISTMLIFWCIRSVVVPQQHCIISRLENWKNLHIYFPPKE